ncbi:MULTISPECIES: flagellar hook-basal body protein [Geobacillus]|uniref:Flagellar hook-basal body protein n=1 Tax=Geobacillus thermoleovorans TaxID=33941 RepID=A0A2Z3N6P5_GEOTH|nr:MULTISPECIES: flagellar hook-basal body protein [Geobacillus]AWO74538.1 flagellar hook-basal body protein [Geobacillus thermoleovorans]MED3722697.1 flagellar hook-basal body protein [Geobacillus stearothermophilus]MED3769299.1 flagellar hook-basal body protein [Geobacillus stearothermophilus]MED3773140.1 flagellar hook-basal body protein [Geobacillus stearothermophilus]ODA15972.1 flagellar biosynthesis protein FlgC [Geobacillus thermoleovorans]
MLRGLYTAASGMLAQERRVEMLTNNLANAETPGYKADAGAMRAFPELLMSRLEDEPIPTASRRAIPTQTVIGPLVTGVYMQELIPNFRQGDVKETGLATDIALVDGQVPVDRASGQRGALFFAVANGQGEVRYTRNGHFTLSPDGYLTTQEGWYVLDANGERIPLSSERFAVRDDGTIIDENGTATRLGVAFAANPQTLIKEGNGLFRSTTGPLPQAPGNVTYTVKQRFLERSNVDIERTMTDLLAAYRAFEANQKIIQAYDRSLDKAVNEVGRLK